MTITSLILATAAVLGIAIMAGLFFIFSNTIMRGLKATPWRSAVLTMQAFNKEIQNSLFLAIFFLTPLLCIAIIILEIISSAPNWITIAAASCYIVGAFLVTLIKNVPMNNELAKMNPSDSQTEDYWHIYLQRWTYWNHIRSVSCVLSLSGFMLVFLLNEI